MNIYVASSWRNPIQPGVVTLLREQGHGVYDFRHPGAGDDGFHWSDIDPDWQSWSPEQFRKSLDHPTAILGFGKDFSAMREADVCVLVLPCGRSAHLEAGWFAGAGKPVVVLLFAGEPELMYRMCSNLCVNERELVELLAVIEGGKHEPVRGRRAAAK